MESKEERLKKVKKWKKKRRSERNKEAPLKPGLTYLASGGLDSTLRVWRLSKKKEVKKLNTNEIYDLDWHPTKDKAVVGTGNKTVEIWDLEQGRRINEFHGHASYVGTVKWGAHGEKIASAAGDGSARIWIPQKGEVGVLKGHEDYMLTDLVWMNNKKILTSAMDKSVKVWIIESEKEGSDIHIKKKTGIISEEILTPTSLAWNAKKEYLAVGTKEGDIQILDDSWEIIQEITHAHKAPVSSIQFNQPGTSLLSGSYDAFTKVWKVKKGKFDAPAEEKKKISTHTLKRHGDSIYKVVWSIDGKWISSCSRDSTIFAWDTKN